MNPHADLSGAYSAWHRCDSIARYLPPAEARALSCIDADVVIYTEYGNEGRTPLLFIEAAFDVGQRTKAASVLQQQCILSGLPGYAVLYRCSTACRNPADPRFPDVDRFRIRRIWPNPETGWRTLTPAEFARGLNLTRQWILKRLPKLIELRKTIAPALAEIFGVMPLDRAFASFVPVPPVMASAGDIRW